MNTNIESFLEECLFLDTETTSANWRDAKIVESGWAQKTRGQWSQGDQLHGLTVELPIKIQSICYITPDMISGLPVFDPMESQLPALIASNQKYLVAHNHFYDKKVLETNGVDLSGRTWICTWRLAKKLLVPGGHVEETNLPYLRFYFDMPMPLNQICHRAGNDSQLTGYLLENLTEIMLARGLLDQSQPLGPQIAQYSASPIIYDRMPFGKYKGYQMSTIPHSYWTWAMNNTNWFTEDSDGFDPDLLESINAVL